MTAPPVLTILILLPLVSAICLIPLMRRESAAKYLALGLTLVELATACWTWSATGNPPAAGAPPGFFLFEDFPWIEDLGIRFTLGMDGISLLMVMMTIALTIICMLVSWRTIKTRTVLHFMLLLAMESTILGVFLALDLFLFYLFWEAMLIPMFFLIGIWGHGRHIYSAVKFFVFTLSGSLLMLLAIIGIYLIHGRAERRLHLQPHRLNRHQP